jgi:hypothetical protein
LLVMSGKSKPQLRPSRLRQEGRFAVVTNVEAGCDGRFCRARRTRHGADGEVVWSRHPDAGVKLRETSFARRWWQQSPVHQGDHEVSRNTIARGMPGETGVTVVTNSYVFYFTYEAAGASGARHSLRPHPRGTISTHSPGARSRRGEESACLATISTSSAPCAQLPLARGPITTGVRD